MSRVSFIKAVVSLHPSFEIIAYICNFFRIMVLDGGRISEFAPPADLLSNRNGVFYGLAKAANLVS